MIWNQCDTPDGPCTVLLPKEKRSNPTAELLHMVERNYCGGLEIEKNELCLSAQLAHESTLR